MILTEAGVGASPLAEHFSIPVLFQAGAANTGIALANVSEAGVQLPLVLQGEDGIEVDRTVINLASGEHLPRFATEFFSSIAVQSDFQGSIEVWASSTIAAIALKQQGSLLTTFPVIVLD